MERTTKPAAGTPGAFTSEAMQALRAAAVAGRRPMVLGYHPHFTTNPYQALLYGRARAHGLAPVPLETVDQIPELTALRRAGLDTILHLHWLHLVLAGTESADDAHARLESFLEMVDDHRQAGGRLVWTVHNILPHGAHEESLEARLSKEIAGRADVIHVMAPGTADHVAPWFHLPRERILQVPHPSYLGAYPDHVTRLDARHELGLMPDEFVYVVVGAIRPYKGLTELLDAWQGLPTGVPRRLLLAGRPSDEPGVDDLVGRAALDPTVLIDARTIPAPEMQLFLRAADVAILPYLRALNSGALVLALTFGLPVIVSAGGGLVEAIDRRFGRTVRPGDIDDLRRAIEDAPAWVTEAAGRAALAHADALAPAIVGERFAAGLRERLEERRDRREAAAPGLRPVSRPQSAAANELVAATTVRAHGHDGRPADGRRREPGRDRERARPVAAKRELA